MRLGGRCFSGCIATFLCSLMSRPRPRTTLPLKEYERYCQLLEELASLLKKGDGEAVESFLFSAVDWRECLDTVRFPRKPKKISCAHGIALFILFGAQPTTTDDTGSTT